MGFDLKKFKNAEFQARTEEVRVDGLAEFFEEGEEPVFTVRGLTAEEVARTNEAASRNTSWSQIMEAMASSNAQERVGAIKQMLGITADVPEDIAKRHEQLTLGSVDPDLDHETVVRLAENCPIEFYTLTNKIMELTGLGANPVKKKGSGKTPGSKQPSPSGTDKDDASSS